MRRNDIHKVLIIGSGPIIIGQACEFDYSGTQACKALRKLGYEIVLVNSNPATIMTDPETADVTYIEPLNVDRLTQIIEKERPDALLPNLGGQSGLNLCSELAAAGVLDKYDVKVKILTGDNPYSTKSVCLLAGINSEKIYLGSDIDKLSDKSLSKVVEKVDVFARLNPIQKERIVRILRENNHVVGYMGDGINDAPVLARADVGIAMGGLGSDAAIEAADVVLMTDEPSKLVDAIDVAKATKQIVMQNIVIALGIKSVFLILGALGIAGMWEAVFGDVGVTIIAVLNAMRILKK